MTWDEWFAHDGIALAERIKRRDVAIGEVLAQSRTALARVDGTLQGSLEFFDDVVDDPGRDGPDPSGPLLQRADVH